MSPRLVLVLIFLLCVDSAGGASVFTGSAIYANVRVYDILAVSFGYSAYGTGVCASSAADTFIAYNMCHNNFLQGFCIGYKNYITLMGRL